MFSCCCPLEVQSSQEEIKEIKQKLIKFQQPSTIQTKGDAIRLQKKEQIIATKQQIQNFTNERLQRMSSLILPSSTQTKSQILQINDISVQARMLLTKSSLKLPDQIDKARKKSDLWLQQAGTKIVYECTTKQQEMVFSYRISHVYNQDINPLNYIINNKTKQKSKDILLCLALFNKTQAQLRSYLKSLQLQQKTRIILGITKPQQQLKTKFYAQKNDIHEIIMMDNISLRLQIFNVIIICCLNQKNFQQILLYCQKLTHKYQLEDLQKIIFILPPQTTLKQIQTLLTRLLRRFLISQNLQKILKYLGYHIQLLKNEQNEYIIIRNNMLLSQTQQRMSRQFQIKLQLAIGLLMIQIKENNFQVYQKLMSNLFVDMTINKYLKTVLFVHKEEKFIINKLQQLKMVQSKHLMEIQNSVRIQEKKISANQKCIIIRHKIKKRMGQFFKEYKWSQTPIQQNYKKQKQWDDELKIHDIKAAMHESQHQNVIDDNMNIFQVISQGQLHDSNFEILQDSQIRYD